MMMTAEEARSIGASVIQGKSIDQGKLQDLYNTLLDERNWPLEPELIMLLGWVGDEQSEMILLRLIRSGRPSDSAAAAMVLLQVNFYQYLPEVVSEIEKTTNEYQSVVKFCLEWHGGKTQGLLGE